ncbi:MAG: cation transporter [Oscillospiraceae bacterium]|nr:cation transporter [Oscillospiraceae bacterium]
MQKITVKVDGMMCSMCESHVNEAVRKALGVDDVKSSHSKGETVITTDKAITEDDVKNAINPTGYTVTGVKFEDAAKKKGLFGLFG